MAHWTLELASACIAGDDIGGPWYDGDTLRVSRAYPIKATLHWCQSTGHRGSVVLAIDRDYIADDIQRVREFCFLDLANLGWRPIPAGEDWQSVKREILKEIRRNKRALAKFKPFPIVIPRR